MLVTSPAIAVEDQMSQTGQPGGPGQPQSGGPPPGWQQQPQPPQPPQPSWQQAPQQPQPPQPRIQTPQQMPAWTANLTSTTPVVGPAGFFYADVPNRSIAMVIDVIAMIFIWVIAGIISAVIFSGGSTAYNIVQFVLGYGVLAAYFLWTWVSMRGTLGMRLLGMQIGHQVDGRTLSYEQGAIRFGVLFGPWIVLGIIAAFVPSLTAITGLLDIVWFIVVLVTMAQSPTKQGIHDRYAQTMVVKAGRTAG
jgi:uncharacterized RDD family membrane protein YckC